MPKCNFPLCLGIFISKDRIMKKLVLLLFVLPALLVQAQRKINPKPFAKNITIEDMRRHLYLIAGAGMEGRETATEGRHPDRLRFRQVIRASLSPDQHDRRPARRVYPSRCGRAPRLARPVRTSAGHPHVPRTRLLYALSPTLPARGDPAIARHDKTGWTGGGEAGAPLIACNTQELNP